MNNNELLSILIELGIRSKEAELYLAMIRHPELSAGELHRLTGINRPRTYALLSEMASRGFCRERVAGRNRYYRAEDPYRLLQRLKRELNQKKEKAESAFAELDVIFKTNSQTKKNLDFIEVLRNDQQLNQAYLSCHRAAKSEILSFNCSPYTSISPELMKEREEAYFKGLKRGVTYRSLYMMEPTQMEWLPCVMDLMDEGENTAVRCVEQLPMKLFIFDSKKVMFMLKGRPADQEDDFSMLVIEDTGFAATFIRLFEFEWETAMTWKEWQAAHTQS